MHQNLQCKYTNYYHVFGMCIACGCVHTLLSFYLFISEEGATGWLKQSRSFRDKQDSYSPKKENGSSLKTTYDHSKNVTLYVSGVPIGLSEVSQSFLYHTHTSNLDAILGRFC